MQLKQKWLWLIQCPCGVVGLQSQVLIAQSGYCQPHSTCFVPVLLQISPNFLNQSSRDAYELFYPYLTDRYDEEFRVLLLDRANKIIQNEIIGEGGFSGTVADPKKIFKKALAVNASGIILGHNHPSDNLKPSESDISLTKKIKRAGEVLDISVLDHIIVGNDNYFSFADESLM